MKFLVAEFRIDHGCPGAGQIVFTQVVGSREEAEQLIAERVLLHEVGWAPVTIGLESSDGSAGFGYRWEVEPIF